jgi:LmbE family N-acetylglucosaminyl deacetylase
MMLTLNRGEGGQNVMSDDYEDALGLVRTQELLSADRYSGVQQFFSRVADFGFSKTREESLLLWGHDRVLSDAVRVVRMTRPLVVTSVFVGGPTDGHGHHQVSGHVPGSDSRRTAALVSTENVCPCPHKFRYAQGNPRLGYRQVFSGAIL